MLLGHVPYQILSQDNGSSSAASPNASGTGNGAVMTPSPVPFTDSAASKPRFGKVTMMAFAARTIIMVEGTRIARGWF